MFKTQKRALAIVCALALIITMLPAQQAQAAKVPAFAKTYTSMYENNAKNGVYTLKVKGLKKGEVVKWTLKGAGSSYATLAATRQVADSSKVTNTVTISTDGDMDAMKAKLKVVARVYTKAGGTLVTKLVNTARINILPTGIAIADDLETSKMYAGQSYQLSYDVTPVNAVGTRVWSATDADGNAVSCITDDGLFTPDAEGDYIITVSAYTGKTKLRATASETVTVTEGMVEVEQIAADKMVVTYSDDVSATASASDFELKNESGSVIAIDGIAVSDDGTQVTLTANTCFTDGVVYTISDSAGALSFTASVGTPQQLAILSNTVTLRKDTAILYAVYDENGIEVSAAYPGTAVIDKDRTAITNGYSCDDTNLIYMDREGDTGTFVLVYTYAGGVLEAAGTVTCVLPEKSTDTNFTLTSSATAPNYSDAAYSDNRQIAAGETAYAHFNALDFDGEALVYDGLTYASSEPDMLMIDSVTGEVTAISAGSVVITVNAVYGSRTYVYTYDVEITEPSYLKAISLDSSKVYISNTSLASDYCQYVNLTATDQYGSAFALNGETYKITALTSATSMPTLTYDADNDRITVKAAGSTAGTYSYNVMITCGSYSASAGFYIVVQAPTASVASSYAIVSSTSDLAITSDTTSTDSKDVTLRIEESKGGIFYEYVGITSAVITKGNLYYGADLTAGGSSEETTIYPASSTKLKLTTLSMGEDNVLVKAATGTYEVKLTFSTSTGSTASVTSSFTLKDSQATPEITVKYRTGDVAYSYALGLAKYCLEVSGASNAEIVECTVTGSDVAGSQYELASGKQVNIASVTVRISTTIGETTAYYDSVVSGVSKTLTNG